MQNVQNKILHTESLGDKIHFDINYNNRFFERPIKIYKNI